MYGDLWPIIINCNGVTRWALLENPIQHMNTTWAIGVMSTANDLCAVGRPFSTPYKGGFIPPDLTRWRVLIELYGLTVGTGFDDFVYLYPDDYVNVEPNIFWVNSTSIYFRNYSTYIN